MEFLEHESLLKYGNGINSINSFCAFPEELKLL